MNILQVSKFYFRKRGAEHYFFELKKALEEQGNNVIPFSMKDKKNEKTKYSKYFVSNISTKPSWNVFANIKTVFRFWWSAEAARNMKQLLADEKIDIAHIHHIYHQISPSILPVIKKAGIPIVMTVHDYSLICPNYNLSLNGKQYSRAVGGRYYQCLQDKCVNNSFVQSFVSVIEMYLHHKVLKVYKKNIDLYIAPSKFVKDKLVNAGYDKSKIKVISHFVGLGGSSGDVTKVSKQLLYSGGLSEEKGLHVLIYAMKKLPEYTLRIAGEGEQKKDLQDLIEILKLDNVKFLGHLSQEKIKKTIQKSYAVVVPSLAPETFGLSCAQSLILGTPVIASNIGALPEMVKEQYLFKPGDCDELVEKIEFLGKEGVKTVINPNDLVEKLSKEKHLKEIQKIYTNLSNIS